MTTVLERTEAGTPGLLSWLVSSRVRRTLRMTSGLILFAYIGAHMFNHALGLVSLEAAEAGMAIGVEVWYSTTGTFVLYGAAATHFLLASSLGERDRTAVRAVGVRYATVYAQGGIVAIESSVVADRQVGPLRTLRFCES